MARALAARGHEVDIYTTDYNGPQSRLDVPSNRLIHNDSVSIYYFHADTLRGWHSVSFSMMRALKNKLQRYDIVHNHSLYMFHDLIVGYYCRKYNIPYLIRTCGVLDPYIFKRHRWRKAVFERLFERRNLRHAAALHFTTEEEKYLAEQSLPFSGGIVVPLGIYIDDYTTLPSSGIFRKIYPKLEGKKVILFFSRINFKKGLDLLIPAFARVASERDDVHLVLSGPDNEGYGEKVRVWIHDWDLEQKVTFTGMLQGETKLAALQDADVFVLPSYSENFGIAVLEAMASCLPVVITNKVNIWREIVSADAGIVVDCDVPQLAAKLLELLKSPDRCAEMGRRGKELVTERYTWANVARMLEENYQYILTNKNQNVSYKVI